MPAKPLTPEQLEDANRLKRLFNEHKARLAQEGKPHAQEDLAELLPFGQSAMSQYINGKIPLNGDALLAFCSVIGCKPWEISPSIYQAERQRASLWVSPSPQATAPTSLVNALGLDVSDALCAADDETLSAITTSLRMMLGLSSGKGHSSGRPTQATQASV